MEGPLLLYKVLLLFSQPLYDWKVNEDLCSSRRDFTHKKIPHLFSFTSDKVDLWAQELIDKDTDFFYYYYFLWGVVYFFDVFV